MTIRQNFLTGKVYQPLMKDLKKSHFVVSLITMRDPNQRIPRVLRRIQPVSGWGSGWVGGWVGVGVCSLRATLRVNMG